MTSNKCAIQKHDECTLKLTTPSKDYLLRMPKHVLANPITLCSAWRLDFEKAIRQGRKHLSVVERRTAEHEKNLTGDKG